MFILTLDGGRATERSQRPKGKRERIDPPASEASRKVLQGLEITFGKYC